MIKLSVVIPSFNGCRKLKRTLEALNNQTCLDFEVILVLDGSTDGSRAYADSFPYGFANYRIVEQRNQGRSLARNNGVEKAQAALLLFLDDDIEVCNDIVERHLQFHEKKRNAVLVGTVFPNIHLFKGSFVQYLYNSYNSYINVVSKSKISFQNFYFTSAHFSISQTSFKALDGFHSSFSDAEDLDFAVRLLKNNISVELDQTLVAYHNDNETVNKYVCRNRSYRRAKTGIREPAIESIKKTAPVRDTPFKLRVIASASSLVSSGIFSMLPVKVRNRVYALLIETLIGL